MTALTGLIKGSALLLKNMYLEKLEIQGFKSFANKNIMVFPGLLSGTKRGITSIVGPNGCGKSNVADSVRWVLGEQSMKTLRGKRSEDVIFSGSDKKGKLGMAEVSLYLNNEDGAAPVDYSELLITRRLYRNGDSEYLLNNSRVRLADIQMLLAKAKFGQKTYSVIGQGMVEGFLNTSLSERKEFFDEATGVKQFQIKRDDSLNKLRSSHENLVKAQMLLNEIEPRLKSLTRQVSKLHKRDETEQALRGKQLKYYSYLWNEINSQFRKYNNEFLELEKAKIVKDKKLESYNRELEQMESESQKTREFMDLQSLLAKEQSEKSIIERELAKLEAQIEVKLEANGKFDISFLLNKQAELKNELISNEEQINGHIQNLEHDKHSQAGANIDKDRIDKEISNLNSALEEASRTEQGGYSKKIKDRLKEIHLKISGLKELDNLEKIIEVVAEIEAEIADIIEMSEQSRDEREINGNLRKIHEDLKRLTQEKEENVTRLSESGLRISARSERTKLLNERSEAVKKELAAIELKLKRQGDDFNENETIRQKEILSQKRDQTDGRIAEIRQKIAGENQAEEEKRGALFSLQRNIQALQNDINGLNASLGELKINSTRYETKLEDLEIEIRNELGSIKDVSNNDQTQVNVENLKEEIGGLKRQLEQIGGIDPQVEAEYNETKERFDFLDGQVKDLDQAIDSLEKVIRELDITIKKQFDKEFKIIAEKFEEYFKILFNGGTSKIIKVIDDEKEESADENGVGAKKEKDESVDADINKIKFLQKHNATGLAGIEIQATPPGKKIQTVTMLSGGERALTAIALICAIISSNPSPFVVLDEVDAALDEANSERLAKILDELSHKTQFIVITHNRASMRKANVLYGVTMGDDKVSKLLSIKLDDAKDAGDNKL